MLFQFFYGRDIFLPGKPRPDVSRNRVRISICLHCIDLLPNLIGIFCLDNHIPAIEFYEYFRLKKIQVGELNMIRMVGLNILYLILKIVCQVTK